MRWLKCPDPIPCRFTVFKPRSHLEVLETVLLHLRLLTRRASAVSSHSSELLPFPPGIASEASVRLASWKVHVRRPVAPVRQAVHVSYQVTAFWLMVAVSAALLLA